MKSVNKKELENLSAYLDGELSSSERDALEEKILHNPNLQAKLEELKKIKYLTSTSFKQVDDSPYFETKVLMQVNSGKTFYAKLKKFTPAIIVAVCTIILMVFFKINPTVFSDLLKNQKDTISSFYKENLKPLFYAADISNEDIYNFAFFKRLPLDKNKKQFLELGSEPAGKEYFEIKNITEPVSQNNFNNFVKVLKLNNAQKHQVDSILSSYARQLGTQVLVNNRNTIAINPDLWSYNKALTAELISFAAKANRSLAEKVIPNSFKLVSNKSLAEVVNKIKNSKPSNRYIFLTPDTVVYDTFVFDPAKIKSEISTLNNNTRNGNSVSEEITIVLNNKVMKFTNKSFNDKHFSVYVDSNGCRVNLSDSQLPNISIPDFDSIATEIDRAAKGFRSFSFKFSTPNMRREEYHFRYDGSDSTKNFDYNVIIPKLDSLFRLNKSMPDIYLKRFFGNRFGFRPDSLQNFNNFFFNDSIMSNQQKFLQEQMKNFQKEIRRMREELMEMKKQLKPFQEEKKKSRSIEI